MKSTSLLTISEYDNMHSNYNLGYIFILLCKHVGPQYNTEVNTSFKTESPMKEYNTNSIQKHL